MQREASRIAGSDRGLPVSKGMCLTVAGREPDDILDLLRNGAFGGFYTTTSTNI